MEWRRGVSAALWWAFISIEGKSLSVQQCSATISPLDPAITTKLPDFGIRHTRKQLFTILVEKGTLKSHPFTVFCSFVSVICFDSQPGHLCTSPHVGTCWCTCWTPLVVVMWPDGNVIRDLFPKEDSHTVPANSCLTPFNGQDSQHRNVSMATLTIAQLSVPAPGNENH